MNMRYATMDDGAARAGMLTDTSYTGQTTNLEQETSARDTCLGFVIIGAGVMLVLLCVGLSFVGALALFGLQVQIVPTPPTPTPLEQILLLWCCRTPTGTGFRLGEEQPQ